MFLFKLSVYMSRPERVVKARMSEGYKSPFPSRVLSQKKKLKKYVSHAERWSDWEPNIVHAWLHYWITVQLNTETHTSFFDAWCMQYGIRYVCLFHSKCSNTDVTVVLYVIVSFSVGSEELVPISECKIKLTSVLAELISFASTAAWESHPKFD